MQGGGAAGRSLCACCRAPGRARTVAVRRKRRRRKLEPSTRRQREGPHRRGHDRRGRAGGPIRRTPSSSSRRAGTRASRWRSSAPRAATAGPHDAGDDEPGAAHAAARYGRAISPRGRGDAGAIAGRRKWPRPTAASSPAVREPGEPGHPPRDDRRGNLARHRRAGSNVVAGVGTGGTITGVAEVLKARKPSARSSRWSRRPRRCFRGGATAPQIQGIGADFIPRCWTGTDRRDHHGHQRGRVQHGLAAGSGRGIWSGFPPGRPRGRRCRWRRPENEGQMIVAVLTRRAVPDHGAVRRPGRQPGGRPCCDWWRPWIPGPGGPLRARGPPLLPGGARPVVATEQRPAVALPPPAPRLTAESLAHDRRGLDPPRRRAGRAYSSTMGWAWPSARPRTR